jgi:transitional endoplasmic reticulum ATPase
MSAEIEPWAHQMGWYLRNCTFHIKQDQGLFKLIEEHAERLANAMSEAEPEDADGDEPEDDGDGEKPIAGTPLSSDAPQTSSSRKLTIKERRVELDAFLSNFKDLPAIRAPLEQNVGFASEEFGLDALDAAILLFILRYSGLQVLEDFSDEFFGKVGGVPRTVAAMLNVREQDVLARLAPGAPLVENGIVVLDRGGQGLSGQQGELKLTPQIYRGMERPYDDREQWIAALLGRPLVAEMEWSAFEHMGQAAELARRSLLGWKENPRPGLNYLIVGPPGTGKTEFGKSLAQEVGLRIWSVGETSHDDAEPGRAVRLSALRLACAILNKKRDGMLGMDEAEDVLQSSRSFGSRRADHSKLHINRVVDTNPCPVIWTCNDTSEMDPATLRRMTQVIEMKVPDRKARHRIWTRVLEREQAESLLSEADLTRFSERWPAPPAVVANAVRLAQLAKGNASDVEWALAASMKVIGLAPIVPERDGGAFDPDLTVCDTDLEDLVRRLSDPTSQTNWSACLFGPSGTGKSEFARHVATRMGIPVHRVRASNILSRYVGDAEKGIASTFSEARAKRALLIIDEAESLIFDRSTATKSWEVSQVDEMLTWMEDHPYPFVATTNSMGQMDKAAFRRFTFKIEFKALDQKRSRLAAKRILGMEPPDTMPDGLTPGDFASIKQKMSFLGKPTTKELERMLFSEMMLKGEQKDKIGFRMAQTAPVVEQAPLSGTTEPRVA